MAAGDGDEVGSGSFRLGGEDVGQEGVLAGDDRGGAGQIGEVVPGVGGAACGG